MTQAPIHSSADRPVVSVLMTAYNSERHLRAAVDSILGQTFRDFEFLILDDGSRDGTLPILREYASRDSRIRPFERANTGLTKALNEGLGHVRGEFVARMDADDVAMPARFEKQVAFLRDHPDHVLVGSRALLVDPDGAPIREKAGIELTHEKIDVALMSMGWPLIHPAVMIRADALRAIRGYDERYITNQDHDLFVRLAERGKLANLPDILLHYRQHFGSVGFTKSAKQVDILPQTVKEACQRRGVPVPPEVEARLKANAVVLAPTNGRVTNREHHHRLWAWQAMEGGNLKTARKHAFATLRYKPLSKESWRVVYCALRGH